MTGGHAFLTHITCSMRVGRGRGLRAPSFPPCDAFALGHEYLGRLMCDCGQEGGGVLVLLPCLDPADSPGCAHND
jgi:hypothetical protein